MATNLNPLSSQFLYSSPIKWTDPFVATQTIRQQANQPVTNTVNKQPTYNQTPQVQGASAPVPTTSGITSVQEPTFSGPSQAEVDAAFNPQLDILNQQENYYRTQELPGTLADIETNRTKLQGELTDQRKQADIDSALQQNTLATNRQSALDDAYRVRNALAQQSRVRFGANSSAGMAVNDIANQETMRQQGGIERVYAGQLGELLNKQTQLYTYLSKRKTDIDDQAQGLIKEANNAFTRKLMEINAARGQVASAKAQMKMDLLAQTNAMVNNIKQAKFAAELQLTTWREQQEQALKMEYDNLNKSFVIDTSSNIFNPYQSSIDETTTMSQARPTQSSVLANAKGKNPLFNEDENPFA